MILYNELSTQVKGSICIFHAPIFHSRLAYYNFTLSEKINYTATESNNKQTSFDGFDIMLDISQCVM